MIDGRVVLERRDDFLHLILNDPPRNEMDGAFFEALERLTTDVLPGERARGMIIRGRGRHFSSGADVGELRDRVAGPGRESAGETLRAATATFQSIAELPFPTVAAVSGVCFGSGLELALSCRCRVAAPRAVFALPETGFGLMPGCGGTVRLPALVGLGRAVELLLTGRTVAADEALAISLVDAVVESPDLLAASERLARRLSAAWA